MESYRRFPLFHETVRCAKMILYLHRTFLTIDSDSAIRTPLSHFFPREFEIQKEKRRTENAGCLEYATDVKINL